MTEGTPRPRRLRDRFAPVPEEHETIGLTARGSLPPELDGRCLRTR
ncbi:hypothetical protein [Streptomyces fuscichromogenes]|nr:hypothetical protein [Streptomyces fuscichromogenes]